MCQKLNLLFLFQIFFFLLFCNAHGQMAESKLCDKPPPIDEAKQQTVAESVRQTFRDFETFKSKEFQTQKLLWDKYFFCLSDVSLNILDLTREQIMKRRVESEKYRLPTILSAFGLEVETSEAKAVAAQVAFLLYKREDALQLAKRAVILNPQNFEPHYILAVIKNDLASADTAIKLKSDFTPAYLLKIKILLSEVRRVEERQQIAKYKAVLEVLNAMLTNSSPPDAQLWREQREGITAVLKFMEANKQTAASTKPEVVKPLKFISMGYIRYTEEARRANVSGTINLMVNFGADGQVKNVFVLKSLPGGLTQEAIAAAKQIKFEPETRNGVPISTMRVVEYGFNIR